MRKSSQYHPQKVKTQGVIRHYGWADRDLGPKMDLKKVGESWNLVQRRLHGMESRDGAMRWLSFVAGAIRWGAQKGGLRGFQAGSCVYGATLVHYPYQPIDLYLPTLQAPPFVWRDFPLPQPPLFCVDLWALSPSLAAYQRTAAADMKIHPDVGNDYAECWEYTCADFWAQNPSLSEYEVAAEAATVVHPPGLATGEAEDCWEFTIEPVPVPVDPPFPSEPTCDQLLAETLAACDRLDEPYRTQCRTQTQEMRASGKWVWPDCWGPLPPSQDAAHEYSLTEEEATEIVLPHTQANTELPMDESHEVTKVQTEQSSTADAGALQAAAVNTGFDRLFDRIHDVDDRQVRVTGDYDTDADASLRAQAEFKGIDDVTGEVVARYENGGGSRLRSTMKLKYNVQLPRFAASPSPGDAYTVRHTVEGRNRYDQTKRDSAVKLFNVSLRSGTLAQLNIRTTWLDEGEETDGYTVSTSSTDDYPKWEEIDGVLVPAWRPASLSSVNFYALSGTVIYAHRGILWRTSVGDGCTPLLQPTMRQRISSTTSVVRSALVQVPITWNDDDDKIQFDTGMIGWRRFDANCDSLGDLFVRYRTV